MKLKITAPKIINLIIGMVVLFFIITFASLYLARSVNNSVDSLESTSSQLIKTLPPIDPDLSIELPYHIYQRLKDSLRINRIMINGMSYGGASGLGPIGIQKSERCDSCSFKNAYSENLKLTKKEYLLRMFWWKLDTGKVSYPTQFYVKKGKSYLRRTTCKLIEKKKGHISYHCMENDIAVPFRYDTTKKNLMIPISAGTMAVLMPLAVCLSIVSILYFLYFIVGNFIKFIIDIAQGNTFSESNINRLKIITWSLFFIPIAQLLLNFLPYLLFHRYFSTDIVLNTDFWMELCKPIALYLISAAIWAAFRKGKQLKEESDLTV